MFRSVTIGVVGCVCVIGGLGRPVDGADGSQTVALAEYVDVDARIFLEVRDANVLKHSAAGLALGEVLASLVSQVKGPESPIQFSTTGDHNSTVGNPASSQPAAEGPGVATRPMVDGPLPAPLFEAGAAGRPSNGLAWRKLFAGALGLEGEQTADLLLDGCLAVAVDGWQELSNAVLIAHPTRPEALESYLAARRIPVGDGRRVRRYALARDHELACDGRVAVVGLRSRPGDLYTRTLALLEAERGVSLADLAEFRERMSEVPAGSHIVLYLGSNRRRARQAESALGWLPIMAALPRSAVVGVTLTQQGVEVEATSRLAEVGAPPVSRDPPIENLLFLPASTLAAWTQPIDYVERYRQLRAANPQGVVRFFMDVLQWQMPTGGLEQHLFGHLVGDTVVMVGAVSVCPPGRDATDGLLEVPSLAVTVETDDPDSVEGILEQLGRNLLRLVNLQYPPEEQIDLTHEVVGDGGASIRSVSLGSLLPPGAARELFGSVEFSWAVADRWVIVATHRETVRQIMLARRGEVPLMPADAVQQAMARTQHPRRLPDMVLVAQPRIAATIIHSWLRYIDRHHPEMLDIGWWQQLRRRYWASQVQLGIMPVVGVVPGEVQVSQTLPNWPAHGRLEPGDRIVAVDGRPLAVDQAMQSLRERLARRRRDDRVTLTVVRGGDRQEIEIPMGAGGGFPADYVQPLALLRQLAELSDSFAFASYVTWQPSRDLVKTRLELRLAPVASPVPAPVD